MAPSAAEKQKRYRERQKAKLGGNIVKQKDAERKRIARRRDPRAAEKHKNYCRKWRAAKKMAMQPATPTLYSQPSSLKRAVKRVSAALPKSPNKRKKVVSVLSHAFNSTVTK